MVDIDHSYAYSQHSTLISNEHRFLLSLATEKSTLCDTPFFKGTLKHPMETARCLRVISNLVDTRFYTHPSMLERILREADPIVTASRSMLRFEGFSSCCSAYARLDIPEDAYISEKIVPGTTNVDFGAEMRAALATVRNDFKVDFSVSTGTFEADYNGEQIVEKKVKLPLRWVKGLSEVQAQQLDTSLRFSVSRSDAIRFLRQLPKSASRHPCWVISAGNGLRLSRVSSKDGIKIEGIERLRVIEELALISSQLNVYSNESNTLSVWVLLIGSQRFTLVLSANASRGFSGEGALLNSLGANTSSAALAKVKSKLVWQDAISPNDFVDELLETPEAVQSALSICALNGVVGYDAFSGSFFHRVLPFDLKSIESLSPRLKSARKLVASNAIFVSKSQDKYEAEVVSGDVIHKVKITPDGDQCTCPWYAKYQGKRGPCKHVLATNIYIEQTKG